jgi:hypothetical protein
MRVDRTGRVLRIFMIFILVLAGIGVLYPLASQADDMQLPTSGQSFTSCAAVFPGLSAEPSSANPIGVGTIAIGGDTLDLQIGLDPFSGPVDIYLGISVDSAKSLYILTDENTLQDASDGIIPWKTAVVSAFDEDVTGAITASSLPPGIYTIYLAVTPAGNAGSYYLWQTSFSTTPPLVASPACKDFGTVDLGQAPPSQSIAIVNTGGEPFNYEQPTTTGENATDFLITNQDCSTLNPGDSCSMKVTFSPNSAGKKTAQMIVPFTAAGGQTKIEVPVFLQADASPSACTYTVVSSQTNSLNDSIGSGAASGQITVTASDPTCSWTANSNNADWLTITSPATFPQTGNNTITYSAGANTTAQSRQGTITIANYTFTVTQDGASSSTTCNPTVSPTTFAVGASGGSYSVNVTAASGCQWQAGVSIFNAGWITVTSGKSYTGSQTVKFTVAPSSTSRTGSLTVGSTTVTVNQTGSGCSYSVSPNGSTTFGLSGGSGSFTVTTGSSCPSTVESTATSWLTITSAASGQGSRTVSYSVAASSVSRSASIYVDQAPGAASFTVTQSQNAPSGGCTYSLSSYNKSFTSSGGSGSFTVSATSGCSWTAVSNYPTWLHITSGSSGSGSGTVSYTVDSATSGRSGTITAAGQTYTVTESGPVSSGQINYTNLPVNNPQGWTEGGNGPNGLYFYSLIAPAGKKTMQIYLAGKVPSAYNNDMLVSDTDFGSASNALALYNYFKQTYGYGGREIDNLAYNGAHYWFAFTSSPDSEAINSMSSPSGTYYMLVINTTPYSSLFEIEANAF